ncbi:MAG TPA: hypothetical protein VEV43_12775, partial [Actinomycetota bacterium]|nr:hypothetical protein [Actinomycetota bacterium]
MAESKLQPVQEVDFPARATAIRDQLTQLTRERRAELREFSRSLVTRIEKTLDYLLVISAAVDPHLVTERMVRAVTEELDDLNGGLENFADGGGVPYLQRIDIATDGVLDALGIWVGLINEPTYDAIRKAASAYRRSLGQQLINVRGDLRSLQQSFAAFQKTQSEARREFENELASERERIEELISSVQQQTTQLSEAITAQASRAEQVS